MPEAIFGVAVQRRCVKVDDASLQRCVDAGVDLILADGGNWLARVL
jgi:hypothetical protein